MSEEKKSEVTEEVKEARKLTEEELDKVTGGTEQELRFAIREGGRTVGAGKTTDIV